MDAPLDFSQTNLHCANIPKRSIICDHCEESIRILEPRVDLLAFVSDHAHCPVAEGIG